MSTSTITIQPFQPEHLPQLRDLINLHIEAIVPGWSLPDDYIHARLQSDPGQYVIGPWVIERQTLCAISRDRVVAVAHLLRYGTDDRISTTYHGAVDLAWMLFYPDDIDAAQMLLDACHQQMETWQVVNRSAWDSGLPIPVTPGIADAWPHVRALFFNAGYRPTPDRNEAAFVGTLHQIPAPGIPPIDGLTLRRWLRNDRGVTFSAFIDGREIGWCQCLADLTGGGGRPALRGWAELTELYVDEQWRRRGVAHWLIRHTAAWVRMAGCDRVIFSVTADDEADAAGALYHSLGWYALTRFEDGWQYAGH